MLLTSIVSDIIILNHKRYFRKMENTKTMFCGFIFPSQLTQRLF